MEKKYWSAIALAAVCLLGSCGKKNTSASTQTEQTAPANAECPTFNADSAYQFTADQCDFGPRTPNSEAHKACGNYSCVVYSLRSHYHRSVRRPERL